MPVKKHADMARAAMKELLIYKPEFEPMIKIYAEMLNQYEILTKNYVKSGLKYDEETGSGTKKAPIVTTLESLRKDILTYAAQLGLTPNGLLKIHESAFTIKKKNGILGEIRKYETG